MWAGTWRVRVRADENVVRKRRGRRERKVRNGDIVAWWAGGGDGFGGWRRGWRWFDGDGR